MSWDAYINDSLIGSGHMHSACIAGLADGGYWAYGGTYIPQPDEVQAILAALKDPSKIFTGGVTIGTVKFMGLRGDANHLIFKKGPAGGCVFKSGQAIIIGVYGDPNGTNELLDKGASGAQVNPADCNSTVERIAKYLIEIGY